MKERQRKLIDILSREKGYTRVRDLSHRLKVSQRTIHYDLTLIEGVDPNLSIKRKRGVGVKIVWRSSPDPILEKTYAEKRQLMIFKKLLFNAETVTVSGLAEMFFTSTSSILNDLESIRNVYLNDKTVQLEASAKGTRLVGTENQWQRTMITFNESIFSSLSYIKDLKSYTEQLYEYYNPVVVQHCEAMIHGLENYNLYSVSNYYELNIFNVLLVMVHRMLEGKHANFDGDLLILDEVLAMKHYLIASDILELLANDLQFSYNDNDIHSLSIYLQANRLEFSPSQSFDDPLFSKSTRSMIERMSISLNVDLNDDEVLYQNILVHLYHLVYRMKQKIYIANPLIEEIKTHFRLLYDLTWLVFDGEKKSLGITVNEDELGFLMLHFQSALDRVEKSQRILVVCPKGMVASSFIVNRIQRILPPLDVVELASVDKLRNYDLSGIKLIISTMPLENMEIDVVIVSPLITDFDLANIEASYKGSMNRNALGQSMQLRTLPNYLNRDLIKVNKENTSMEQVIRVMCEELLDRGIVKEGYHSSVLERESLGGTELESGAAVPHGTFNLVNETVIPILISESPILWNGTDVHIVVFFVIAKKDLRKSKEILKDVYKLLESEQKIHQELRFLNQRDVFDYIAR